MNRPPEWYLPLVFGLLAVLFAGADLRGTVRIGAQMLLLAPFVLAFLSGRCAFGLQRVPRFFLLALAVIGLASLSALLVVDGLPPVKLLARTAAFLYLVSGISMLWSCAGERSVLRALRTYSYVTVGLVFAFYLWQLSAGEQEGRFSLAHNPNELAMILLAAMPGLLWRMNRLSIPLLAALLYLILMTSSRASLLGALAMLLVWLVVEKRVRLRMMAGVSFVLALVPAGMWLFLDLPIIRQLMRTSSILRRLECWQYGLKSFGQNFMTGTGLGLHSEFVRGHLGNLGIPQGRGCSHAHNEAFALLADMGLAGALAWGGVLLLAAGRMWKRRREDAISRLALAVLAGYLVVGLAETMYLRGGHMLWFVAMLLLLRHIVPPAGGGGAGGGAGGGRPSEAA